MPPKPWSCWPGIPRRDAGVHPGYHGLAKKKLGEPVDGGFPFGLPNNFKL